MPDRVVLLTGASRGIGRALAERLAGQGACLILTSRAKRDLEAVADALEHPERVAVVEAYLAKAGDAERLAAAALAVHGRVDVLVNNAGVGYFALLEEATEEKLRQLFEVNTFAPLLLAQALLPALKESEDGRIVNVVSALGRAPVPTVGVYGASKTALAVLGNVLRLEIEPSGVVVENVYPGTVDTDFERHAEREAGRLGLSPGGGIGLSAAEAADAILEAAAGSGGEVWLEPEGRKMAAAAIVEPRTVDRQLAPLRDHLLHASRGAKPAEARIWRRWRVEVARPGTIRCDRCPNRRSDPEPEASGLLSDDVWVALQPYLGEVAEVSFLGGGDALIHPRLVDFVAQAREAGARASVRTAGGRLDDETVDRLLGAHTDWVEVTLGGARPDTFARSRPDLDFETFRRNVRRLTTRRKAGTTDVSFRYVLVRHAEPELEGVIRLADDLDVDRVSVTHCDVVRDLDAGAPTLFGYSGDPEIRALEKELRRARRVAKRLRIETHASSFVPEEQPVCGFDPLTSLFVRHDGTVAPCLNLGLGGKTCFLGTTVAMPALPYGTVGEREGSPRSLALAGSPRLPRRFRGPCEGGGGRHLACDARALPPPPAGDPGSGGPRGDAGPARSVPPVPLPLQPLGMHQMHDWGQTPVVHLARVPPISRRRRPPGLAAP